MHIHQHLDLYVDGRKVPVPAGIGIHPAVEFAPLHTHDASGVIHVESPTVRTYTLGQFFAVWGAVHAELPWRLLRRRRPAVAGLRQRRRLPGRPHHAALGSRQELVVAFGTASHLPSPIPSTYRVPSGL